MTASSDPTSIEPLRLDWIDALRGLAALYVVLEHITLHLWKNTAAHPLFIQTAHALFSHAQYAVSLFIVLSGFCLMIPSARNGGFLHGGLKEFARRRCRRILPPYYACLLLSLALLQLTPVGNPTGTFWSMALPESPGKLAIHSAVHALLLHDFYGPYKINYPLWSIAVEFHLYFLFPVLLLFWRKCGTLALTLVCGSVVLLFEWVPPPKVLPMGWQLLASFGFGMSAAAVAFSPGHERIRIIVRKIPDIAWLPLVATAGYLATFALPESYLPNAGFGLVAALLMIRLAVTPQRLLMAPLCRPALVFLGSFSYSLYLIHAPLIQLIYLTLVRPLTSSPATGTLLLFCFTIPLVLGAAYLFHQKFELPYLRAAKSRPATTMTPKCL